MGAIDIKYSAVNGEVSTHDALQTEFLETRSEKSIRSNMNSLSNKLTDENFKLGIDFLDEFNDNDIFKLAIQGNLLPAIAAISQKLVPADAIAEVENCFTLLHVAAYHGNG